MSITYFSRPPRCLCRSAVVVFSFFGKGRRRGGDRDALSDSPAPRTARGGGADGRRRWTLDGGPGRVRESETETWPACRFVNARLTSDQSRENKWALGTDGKKLITSNIRRCAHRHKTQEIRLHRRIWLPKIMSV